MKLKLVRTFVLSVVLTGVTYISAQAPSAKVVQQMRELRESDKTSVEKLNKIFDLAWQYNMLESPEFATFTGFPGQNHRWSDQSLEAIKRRKQDQLELVRFLASLDMTAASEADQLNYQLFNQLMNDQAEAMRFPTELLPMNQMNGPQVGIPQLMSIMPIHNEAAQKDFLSRLEGIPQVLAQTQTLLEKGLAQKITPPKITLRGLPAQILAQIPEKALDSPILTPLKSLKDDDAGQAFRQKATKVFNEKVRPAFQSFHDYVAKTYIPGSRESIGLSEAPNGKAWYKYQVRQNTTTDLTPQEIHQIGLSEVKRIRGEMEAIIKETGFEGDFNAFTEFLRTDPQFYFTSKEALLASYRDISKRADAELVKLFGVLPRLPYGVIAVPAYQEKTATTAYYNPGSLETGRPGYFYANTYDLKSRPKWEMEALTLHEAVPGHHLQIALGQELENVPRFRTFSFTTAFVEGWGLYSESLGEAMGFYKDPYSKFGQLTYEMWRAIRLVVDTGIHELGWTRQQAIDYFKANTGKSEHDITVEVDRYIVWPGQALAYKIGELKIKELRALAEKELGDQFDIRGFHDRLLGAGAIPLSLLETRMKAWIAEQKSS